MSFDYFRLQALSTVIHEGSFQRAADKLFVTQSAVSQRIQALENDAGQPLLVRSTPPLPTELGRKYLSVFAQMEALWASVSASSVTKLKIPLACNTESFEIWLSRCLSDFSKEMNVLFDIQLEDQDQTLERLREAKVLGCLSSQKGPAQGCSSYPLKDMTYVCVANRDFIQRFSLEKDRRGKILDAPTVIYGIHDRIHDNFLCELLKTKKRPAYSAHTIPSISAILQHVLNGSAYAVLPETLVRESIRSGLLVDLFPKCRLKVPLYWHCVQTDIPILKKLTERILTDGM